VFAPVYNGGIYKVSEAGGAATEISTLDSARSEDSHRFPSMLPDGKHFTYLRRSTMEEKSAVAVGSVDDPGFDFLFPGRSNAIYANPGYLLFVREFALMAQPFDPSTRKLTGQAFPITDQVGYDQAFSIGLFSASTDGVLAFDIGSGTLGARELAWFDSAGKRTGAVRATGSIYDFSLSPDERQVAFRRIDPSTQNQDIWIADLERQTESRFTFSQATDDDPTWSPDGKYLYFDSRPGGTPNLYRKLASGTGTDELVLKTPVLCTPLDYSLDGKYLMLQMLDPKTKEDLWALPMHGDSAGTPFAYLHSNASEYSGKFSPDTRWVAYASDETGKYEVYIQAFPQASGKFQVSTGGGGNPMWSKNGKELYFLAPDKRLMAVDIDGSGSSPRLGIPRPLFSTGVDIFASVNRYAVTREGRRFIVNTAVTVGGDRPIEVVMNWTAGLEKK
jgi:dipeptidyl aminopeptidase/acylaminoacyl peptidase